MTELAFEPQCSNCLIFLSINAGHVLSCGDFFCPSCCNLLHEHFQRNICPSCGVKEIQIVQLSNPPNEVLLTLTNPAQSLQTHFDSLKFQILHYKKMLRQSTSLLNKMENERQQLIK